MNRLRLTAMSLLISFTLGGLGSQIGLFVNPIRDTFGITQTLAAAQFSWLTGGILAGNVLAFAVLRYAGLKLVVAACYGALIAGAMVLHALPVFALLPVCLALIGAAAGIGVVAASTIIAQLWDGRRRQSVLVGQDAMFNSGGIAFPLAAGWLLANQFAWTWGYLTIAGVGAVIVLLAIVSRFDFETAARQAESSGSEWPFELVVAGLCLFSIIVALISITIWLPVYAGNNFGAAPDEAAGIISRIYTSALIGSLVFTAIVMRVRISSFIAVVALIGAIASWAFVHVATLDAIMLVAYAYGVAIAAIYHSFIAWGLSYTRRPTYKHVTFLYVLPGIGGTVAPYLSSRIVDLAGIQPVFVVCAFLYGAVFAAVLLLDLRHRRAEALPPGTSREPET